jgi:ATP-binding cassette subfamily B protein
MRGRVAFEDVTFSYRGTTGEPVLQHVSLEPRPANGSHPGGHRRWQEQPGCLIPRFYDVNAGRVTIDAGTCAT